MKKGNVAAILSLALLPSVVSQDGYWPTHTVCNSDKIKMSYKSCGPSIDELYTSVDLSLNGISFGQLDEPLCLPNFPCLRNDQLPSIFTKHDHTKVMSEEQRIQGIPSQ
ncbi:hypothetical protein P4O66_010084 [Electrophorus voltai]|uniref:Lymphocyte antigen 86 n=1 Tax=Electrophorus voltai TaxID=2609070 RepID=A0AAD9DVP1_9TELE|nr:hypothetical protein P4O66_010084 [Electrophorus voltai]